MRLIRHHLLMVLSLLFLIPATAQAQSQESEKPVQGLLFGSSDIFVELHGFLNIEAFYFQKEAVDNFPPSFDLHNWYFSAKAQVAKQFTLFTEVEYEHGTENIILDQAFFDWKAAPWMTTRIGRFFVPLSYERTHYLAPVRPMTSRPFMVDVAFHEWSDTGLELFGSLTPRTGLIQYDLAVANGPQGLSEVGLPQGIGISDTDNNRNKTVVGRLNVNPIPGLTVGAAYATGEYDDKGKLGFKVFEYDGRYTVGRLDLWGEFMKRTGDDEPTAILPFTGTKADLQGYYLLAAYNVIENTPNFYYLKPIVRYDTLFENTTHNGEHRLTVGLNYSPKGRIVFKSEYQFTRETGQPQKNNNGAMFSAVLDF
jgi:hypothetical protein